MTPRTLKDFMLRTGWEEHSRERLDRMQTAFDFFSRVVQPRQLMGESTTDHHGGNAWTFKIDGRMTRLCAWMQCICFDGHVMVSTLKQGARLKKFRDSRSNRGDPASGEWFTSMAESQERLAIKPNQSIDHHFVARRETSVLKCVVADAVVDWRMNIPKGAMPQVNVDYWYRKGGGEQIFVWNSASVLDPI
jgi:hypothetical protein